MSVGVVVSFCLRSLSDAVLLGGSRDGDVDSCTRWITFTVVGLTVILSMLVTCLKQAEVWTMQPDGAA